VIYKQTTLQEDACAYLHHRQLLHAIIGRILNGETILRRRGTV
jgi:hypothetical protein